MRQVDGKNVEKVVAFIAGLTDVDDHFCEYTLRLFAKIFELNSLVFYCRSGNADESEMSAFELIGRNIDIIHMRRFIARYYHDDIFMPSNLPPEKRGQRLLTTDDLTQREEYECSTYGQFMASIGLYYQACIYLYHDGEWIGHILIFHSKAEGNFTAEELEVFGAVGKCLENLYYRQCFKMEAVIRDFHRQYDDMNLGAALLNNDLKVMAMNDTLLSYCSYILDNGSIDIHKLLSGDVIASEDVFVVQQLINHFGSNIVAKPERIWIDCIRYNFQINVKLLFVNGASGKIKTYYLFLMTRFSKIRSATSLRFLDELTPRELDVLTLVLAGTDNTETAEQMNVSIHTVKTHLEHIYRKFGVTNKAELFAMLYGGKKL